MIQLRWLADPNTTTKEPVLQYREGDVETFHMGSFVETRRVWSDWADVPLVVAAQPPHPAERS